MSREINFCHVEQVIRARLLAAHDFADHSATHRYEVMACRHLLIRFFNEHDVSNHDARRLIALIEDAI
ncbi:hypothetical protein [Caballeronia sp. GAWG2-1]|uniref:hypothetical protein n=1 Tax=Caballeronia sp. GAWG2-1 TaxID=2921744 RepID=UPI002028B194|nr:hypothetical protein [Caballeronia sp. GAWG2-1]